MLLFVLSFILVAFGQSSWVPEFGLIAAACGYALFWKRMLTFQKRAHRFWLALCWFGAVHAIQLSWMTSITYMGPLMLGVYVFLLLGLGAQFGLFSSFLRFETRFSFLQVFALSGFFVFLEWSRLYFFTGFTWNPVGLALVGNRYSIQLAALFGVYGLSFWVILTNLSALFFFIKPELKRGVAWGLLVLFPYGFGLINEAAAKRYFVKEENFTVAVVETALRVEEKNRERQRPDLFIPALRQWERIFGFLNQGRTVDLIVLPEAALPYGFNHSFCPLSVVERKWESYFGPESISDFPPLIAPFAYFDERVDGWVITNAFIAQGLANHFQSELIVGLDYDGEGQRTNAAFLFRPQETVPERYDKRILVPVGEYIPFGTIQWVAEFLASQFGIEGSFFCGKEAKVFSAKYPIGIVICLEELYSSLVQDLRKKGAKLLVSLSNDVWFPSSRLARQHFDHGRVRAVENGIFLFRSSNMGITGGVDCFGQPIGLLSSPEQAGATFFSMPVFSYFTLYSWWGDTAILCLSAVFLGAVLVKNTKKLLLNQRVG